MNENTPVSHNVPELNWQQRNTLAQALPEFEQPLLEPGNITGLLQLDSTITAARYNPSNNRDLSEVLDTFANEFSRTPEYVTGLFKQYLVEFGVPPQLIGENLHVMVVSGNAYGFHDHHIQRLKRIRPSSLVVSKIFTSPEFYRNMRLFYGAVNVFAKEIDTIGRSFDKVALLDRPADRLPEMTVRQAGLSWLTEKWQYEGVFWGSHEDKPSKEKGASILARLNYFDLHPEELAETWFQYGTPAWRNHGLAIARMEREGRLAIFNINARSSGKFLDALSDIQDGGVFVGVINSNFEWLQSHKVWSGHPPDGEGGDGVPYLIPDDELRNRGINQIGGIEQDLTLQYTTDRRVLIVTGDYKTILKKGQSRDDLLERVKPLRDQIQQAISSGIQVVGLFPGNPFAQHMDLSVAKPGGTMMSNIASGETVSDLINVLGIPLAPEFYFPTNRLDDHKQPIPLNNHWMLGQEGLVFDGQADNEAVAIAPVVPAHELLVGVFEPGRVVTPKTLETTAPPKIIFQYPDV